jgi:hypothetical protein
MKSETGFDRAPTPAHAADRRFDFVAEVWRSLDECG